MHFLLNENVWISLKFPLKFVPKGPINNIPELVQIMAWRRPGDKPSSEPMLVFVPTHICVTRPQWVKWLWRQDMGTFLHYWPFKLRVESTGDSPHKAPVMRSFCVFFVTSLNILLNKQSSCWFGTTWRSPWDVTVMPHFLALSRARRQPSCRGGGGP